MFGARAQSIKQCYPPLGAAQVVTGKEFARADHQMPFLNVLDEAAWLPHESTA
jgi:hypothetical protein